MIGSNDCGRNCKECDGTCNVGFETAKSKNTMSVFVTFGQAHVHSVNGIRFDKDSIAEIECSDYGDGRKKAFEYFGDKFFTTYTREQIEKSIHHFPRGIIKVN